MTSPFLTEQSPDFSLVLGGPTFQFFRRSHLSGNHLELLYRRILAICLVVWVPLLLLTLLEGHFRAGTVGLPFLRDIEAHVRLLVALPILIASELIVHLRIRPSVKTFLTRRIIREQDLPKYQAAINSAIRLRNSMPLELVLLLCVLTLGQWLWRSQLAMGGSTWYANPRGGRLHLTGAGYWYVLVSIPIFQFIFIRWYCRFFIWFRFLWQVSRLDLNLIATHPDRAAGIAFLGKSSYAFGPILFAQGALLAGVIASHVLYAGESLLSFKMEAGGMIGFFLLFILGPLTMFTPQLSNAKRKGRSEYGLLASRYVEGFDDKWVKGDAAKGSELLGAADIQSLADLGNSYGAVREMRVVPFGFDDITRLAAAIAVPLLPLGLTIFSLEELVIKIFKVLL
jgi:hypothetical protein